MKIAICGDVSITKEASENFERKDEKAAFGGVLDYFSQCDNVIINLECALTDSENAIKKFGPNLKATKNAAETFKKAGVTECALSNNHIFDYGIEGVEDTIKELDKVGIKWTGFGKNYEDSRKNYFIEKDGLSIGIVNVCEHEYTYATENRMGARPFDEFETMDDIRNAKKSADYVIVIYHGGKEHCRYPSPRLMKACREMVRCGADAVLCQHSHIIGCYEKFENAHILYGQGNFHFVKYLDNKEWAQGLMVELEITKEKIDIEYIPVVAGDTGINLAEGEEREQILAAFWERSETLHNGEWKNRWHAFCEKMYNQYKKAICGYDAEDDAVKTQQFAHYLDCEAHTDVWREIFPTWNQTNELDKGNIRLR